MENITQEKSLHINPKRQFSVRQVFNGNFEIHYFFACTNLSEVIMINVHEVVKRHCYLGSLLWIIQYVSYVYWKLFRLFLLMAILKSAIERLFSLICNTLRIDHFLVTYQHDLNIFKSLAPHDVWPLLIKNKDTILHADVGIQVVPLWTHWCQKFPAPFDTIICFVFIRPISVVNIILNL